MSSFPLRPSPHLPPPAALLQYERCLHALLSHSELFNLYRCAFQSATGRDLLVICAEHHWVLNHQAPAALTTPERPGPFRGDDPLGLATQEAGSSSFIPIKIGPAVFSFLKTSASGLPLPAEPRYYELSERLVAQGLHAGEIQLLRKSYLESQARDPARHSTCAELLNAVAKKLSLHAEYLATRGEGLEPQPVARARYHVHTHFHQSLPLGEVARAAGLSESHFCRVFKKETGWTLTDYITQCRIGWAQRELLHPTARISDVAFNVGFQSLAQFNRSFARMTGCSPSAYRAANHGSSTPEGSGRKDLSEPDS